MEQIPCLNFCEIFEYEKNQKHCYEEILKTALKQAEYTEIKRLYIGSYFCGQYFLHMKVERLKEFLDVCAKGVGENKDPINITLVLPIFSEKDLSRGKEKLQTVLHEMNTIDEITVNDYGMLQYVNEVYGLPINIGRIFMKDYRDPRYEEYFNQIVEPKIFTEYLTRLVETYHIIGLEFDPTHSGLDFGAVKLPSNKDGRELTIGIHDPYCYMTVGQICELASIPKSMEQKFRPNSSCQLECSEHIYQFEIEENMQWTRIGKTIYSYNPTCQIEGIQSYRRIFCPLKLEVE